MAIKKIYGITVISIFYAMFQCVAAANESDMPEGIERIRAAVVTMLTYKTDGKESGEATGFFLENEGALVTNFHVAIQYGSHLKARTSNGKVHEINFIADSNQILDLAKLYMEVPRQQLKGLKINKSLPDLGEQLTIVGGLHLDSGSIQNGTVVAIGPHISAGNVEFIQIGVGLRPGFSGSPVVNMRGELVGVITACTNDLSFAIPAKQLLKTSRSKLQSLSDWRGTFSRGFIAAYELNHIGQQLAGMNQYEESLGYFEKALGRDPNFSEAWRNMGYSREQLARHQEAIDAYKQALILTPNNAWIFLNMGSAYLRMDRLDESIMASKKAIEINPNVVEAYINLSYANVVLGQYEEALRASERALELNSKDPSAYNMRGNVYSRLGKMTEALNDFDKAIELNPKYSSAYEGRGNVYLERKEYNRAIQECTKAIELDPRHGHGFYTRGRVYMGIDKDVNAISDFTKSIEIMPEYAPAYQARGAVYLGLKNYGSAISDLTKCIELKPNLAEAYYIRAVAYVISGKLEEAKNDCQKAIHYSPELKEMVKQLSNVYKLGLEFD